MILPTKLNHQPGYPAGINRQNWLGRRVTKCISSHYKKLGTEMTSGLPGFQIGAVDNTVLTPGGWGSSPAGNTGAYWNGTPDFCCFANASNSLDSVVVYFTRTGSNGQFTRLVDLATGGGGWDFETDASNGVGLVTWFGGANFNFTTTGTLPIGQPQMLGFSYTPTTANPNAFCYYNGKLLQSAFTGVTSSVNTALIMHCHDLAGANCGTNYAIHYIAFFHGTSLSATDHQALYRNPWMLFGGRQTIIPKSGSVTLTASASFSASGVFAPVATSSTPSSASFSASGVLSPAAAEHINAPTYTGLLLNG